MEVREFYVYIWRDPKNRTPIYVGKGHKHRCWDHIEINSSAHYARILKKRHRNGYVCLPQIIWCESENLALELEVFLIAEIGRKDLGKGPLLNRTDGGEGVSNQSDATKRKHSRNTKVALNRPEVKARLEARWTGEQRARRIAALRIAQNRPEVRAKRSASIRLAMSRKDVRANVSAAAKSRPKIHCPHCNASGQASNMKRWHFDNCRELLRHAK